MRHIRYHGPDAPRPLLVDKLVEAAATDLKLLRERDQTWNSPTYGKLLPPTWEQMEKAAAKIGAREPEIEAALDRLNAEFTGR